ncbi:MAG: hypothetical protein V1721_04640 [Pseudomonadota bacterium]
MSEHKGGGAQNAEQAKKIKAAEALLEKKKRKDDEDFLKKKKLKEEEDLREETEVKKHQSGRPGIVPMASKAKSGGAVVKRFGI